MSPEKTYQLTSPVCLLVQRVQHDLCPLEVLVALHLLSSQLVPPLPSHGIKPDSLTLFLTKLQEDFTGLSFRQSLTFIPGPPGKPGTPGIPMGP